MTSSIAPTRLLPSSSPPNEGGESVKSLSKIDRSQVDPMIVQAAEGMESMFLDYMMKVMRQSVPKNEMDLSNPATEIYQGMLDSETAQRAARTGGVGLADQIIAYLDSRRYNLPDAQGGAMKYRKSTGGTE